MRSKYSLSTRGESVTLNFEQITVPIRWNFNGFTVHSTVSKYCLYATCVVFLNAICSVSDSGLHLATHEYEDARRGTDVVRQ